MGPASWSLLLELGVGTADRPPSSQGPGRGVGSSPNPVSRKSFCPIVCCPLCGARPHATVSILPSAMALIQEEGRREEVSSDGRVCTTGVHHLNNVDINICHLLGALGWELVLGVPGLAQGCVYHWWSINACCPFMVIWGY